MQIRLDESQEVEAQVMRDKLQRKKNSNNSAKSVHWYLHCLHSVVKNLTKFLLLDLENYRLRHFQKLVYKNFVRHEFHRVKYFDASCRLNLNRLN